MKSNFFSGFKQAYLIAEIGVNHNGDMRLAKKMILEAKLAGADAVKFQTFRAENLVTKGTPKVKYQENTTSNKETHYEMIKKLELGEQEHHDLYAYCHSVDIDFISTPYDIECAKFLEDLGVKIFKTASADLVDLPLLNYISSTGKPSIVATGMSNLGEVEQAVNIFEDNNNANLILLHCVSNYPCSDASLNLRTMTTMSEAFRLPVGFSDHSSGFLAAVTSIAMGAKVIEKHFTLDKSMCGPDHKASSTPDEFSLLVRNIRQVECMLGIHRKAKQTEESQMAEVSRKSLFFSRPMLRGDVIKISDLKLMRPGDGITANFIPKIIGKRIRTDCNELHQITWNDLEN